MSSILDDVKLSIPIEPDDLSFDVAILMHINATFVILNQLGVLDNAVSIEDRYTQWTDIWYDREVGLIKSYVCAKVKKEFDPPSSSFVLSSLERTIQEYESRLNMLYDKT